MKKFLATLVLSLLFFSAPSQAEDIRDFQIEGMSIGDSALDFFSESEIKEGKKNYYKDNEFSTSVLSNSSNIYDKIEIHYKTNEQKYILYGISGGLLYENKIQNCKKQQDNIASDVSKMFVNIKKKRNTKKHFADKSGKSTTTTIYYNFNAGDRIHITCTDWSKKMEYTDNLRVDLISKKLWSWINTKAYK